VECAATVIWSPRWSDLFHVAPPARALPARADASGVVIFAARRTRQHATHGHMRAENPGGAREGN
jgi:hypothetical protein